MNNEHLEKVQKELAKFKTFLIRKGTPELIEEIKPLLNHISTQFSNKADLALFINENRDEFENFIQSFEEAYNNNYFTSSDKEKLTVFSKKLIENIKQSKQSSIINKKNIDDISQLYSKKSEQKLDEFEYKLETILDEIEKNKSIHQANIQHETEKIQKIVDYADSSKKAFDEEHKLHAAKEYWLKKAKRHTTSALWSFYMFLFPVFLLVVLIFYITQRSSNSVLVDSNQTINETISLVNSSNSLVHYLPYLLIFSLLIWVSRIFLKIMFSNLHLKEEALEKETQILTYLALIKEGAGLENDDRKLILEAIFRPSTNGLIKDESNVTLLDIANIFKGK